MRYWIRRCNSCGYKLKAARETQDKTRTSYIYRKCPSCKSESFDYGSWCGYDTKAWRDKWKVLTGRDLNMPEAELDDLVDNLGEDGLFKDNLMYQHLINLGH